MSSRTRITVALIGLIALVVVGWFVRSFLEHPPAHRGSALPAVAVSTAQVAGLE